MFYPIVDFSSLICCQTYVDNFQSVVVVKMEIYDIEKEDGNIFVFSFFVFWL